MIVRLLGIFVILFSLTSQAASEEVDLELVLAMDASGSISEKDYILQLKGTADAFRDPEVQRAIASGPLGKISVTIMLWSDAAFKKVNSGWYLLDTPQSANIFAKSIERFQLADDDTITGGLGGGTGIGAGVEEALTLIESNKYQGLRRVIDISGDGIETEFDFSKGLMIRDAKKLADLRQVTINGLPILNVNFPKLDDYYRKEVITGPGSFIEVAKDFNDFGRAIRQKLLREISNNLVFNDDDTLKYRHFYKNQLVKYASTAKNYN